jgi:hypothetical protein
MGAVSFLSVAIMQKRKMLVAGSKQKPTVCIRKYCTDTMKAW